MTTDSEYLTVREAAQRVHVSPELIRKWLRDNKLPYIKMGDSRTSLVRIRVDDLIEYVESMKR